MPAVGLVHWNKRLEKASWPALLLVFGVCTTADESNGAGGREGLPSASTVSLNEDELTGYQIIEIGRFGILDGLGSNSEDPRVLGFVRDFVESGDSTLYVVDGAEKSVLHFAPDGSVVGRLGRYGLGPGEFINPFSIAEDSRGRIFVLDIDRAMVSRFSSDRQYQMSFSLQMTVNNGGDIAIQNDSLFVTGSSHDPRRVVHIYDLDGESIGRSVDLDERSLAFSTLGYAGFLASVPSLGLVYADPAPSTWRLVAGPGTRRRGRDALNGREIIVTEIGPRDRWINTPGHTLGVASLGHGRLAVLYMLSHGEGVGPQAKRTYSHVMDVYDLSGHLVGRCELDELKANRPNKLAGGRRDRAGIIYLGLSNPYPYVGKYRVVESSHARREERGICK